MKYSKNRVQGFGSARTKYAELQGELIPTVDKFKYWGSKKCQNVGKSKSINSVNG